MRLIDADALIDDLEHDVAIDEDILNYVGTVGAERINTQFDKDCKQNAIELLLRTPTIEPTVDKDYLVSLIQEAVYDGEACKRLLDLVDRPQGEWIEGEIFYFCGEQQLPMTCSVCGRTALNEPWHYCPNCGADMRKGADDENY